MAIKIAVVGIGEIARNQHIPVLNQHKGFDLVAVASRHTNLPGIDCYSSLEEMIENQPSIEAVALCMPPQARYDIACKTITLNKHLLLEKPPGATLVEVNNLVNQASLASVTLYNSWHSRHALSVESAKNFLQSANIKSVDIQWLEDVRKWHPNQEWIWHVGGMGVFDPGINALSIATYVLPCEFFLKDACLSFPENKQTPIAAELMFLCANDAPVSACFDWRKEGHQFWNISIESDRGTLVLTEGGNRLFIDGQEHKPEQIIGAHDEYEGVYNRFQRLIESSASDTDCRPMTLVADAFMMANRKIVEPFLD